jgi:hypothetical protein
MAEHNLDLQVRSLAAKLISKMLRTRAQTPLLQYDGRVRGDHGIARLVHQRHAYKNPMAISMQMPTFTLGRTWTFHMQNIGKPASVQSQTTETALIHVSGGSSLRFIK